MSITKGIPQETAVVINSEYVSHYGTLIGGPLRIELTGIGPYSAGPGLFSLPRRGLGKFDSFSYGGRPDELPDALNMMNERRVDSWFNSPDRIMTRSARDAREMVFQTYGTSGFVSLDSLTGFAEAAALKAFESVLPTRIADTTLIQTIKHLQSFNPTSDLQVKLRDEMLTAAIEAKQYHLTATSRLREEIANSHINGLGLKDINEASAAIFCDLEILLPSETAKRANVEMGAEIARSVSQQPSVPGLTELVQQLAEQNKLLRDAAKARV